jgi:hypothetical protein
MKKMFLYLLFILFISPTVFSFEMWNGITTEMSMDHIIAQLRNFFQDTTRNKAENGWGKDKPEIYFADASQYSRIYPDDLITYWFRTEVPAYHFMHTGSSPMVYFRNNRFFAIRIPFAADADVVFNAAKEKYGNRFETITENYTLYNGEKRLLTIYKWDTNEKIVYLHSDPKNGTWQPRVLTVINKQLLDEYKQEQINRDEQYRQEREAQRRAANPGIQF